MVGNQEIMTSILVSKRQQNCPASLSTGIGWVLCRLSSSYKTYRIYQLSMVTLEHRWHQHWSSTGTPQTIHRHGTMRSEDWSYWFSWEVSWGTNLQATRITDAGSKQGLDSYHSFLASQFQISFHEGYRPGAVSRTSWSRRRTSGGHYHCFNTLSSTKCKLYGYPSLPPARLADLS